jgi:hypothetical protein
VSLIMNTGQTTYLVKTTRGGIFDGDDSKEGAILGDFIKNYNGQSKVK